MSGSSKEDCIIIDDEDECIAEPMKEKIELELKDVDVDPNMVQIFGDISSDDASDGIIIDDDRRNMGGCRIGGGSSGIVDISRPASGGGAHEIMDAHRGRGGCGLPSSDNSDEIETHTVKRCNGNGVSHRSPDIPPQRRPIVDNLGTGNNQVSSRLFVNPISFNITPDITNFELSIKMDTDENDAGTSYTATVKWSVNKN